MTKMAGAVMEQASPPDERTEEEKLFEKVRDVKVSRDNTETDRPTN